MQAGYAQVEITPAPGEELTGYGYYLNRRCTGALDPLMARAVALGDGESRAVLVQLDLLALSREWVSGVRCEAHELLGLPEERLLLHCTHTHTGPAVTPLYGCGMPSEEFTRGLRRKVLSVVEKALGEMRPVGATSRFAGDFADGFASNRVGGTDLDTHVRGVRLDVPGAGPILILSYACHPVTLGRLDRCSADYPGALMRELNAYGIRALYLNGCCGDINPLSNTVQWGCGTADTLRIYGRDLATAFRQAMRSAVCWQPGPIQGVSRQVPVQALMPERAVLEQELEEIRTSLRSKPDDSLRRVDAIWHERMIGLCESGRMAEASSAEIQAIRCGDVVFVGLAAETFTRLGQIIRESAPGRHLMIAGTSNGVIGYLGTREDVERGGYASAAACKIYGMPLPAPDAGERWAEEGARIVAGV